MYIHDSHIHTMYSHDILGKPSASPELIVKSAIEKGIDEITFADHCDIDDILDGIYPEMDFDALLAEIDVLRERYGDKIRINFGVELGQPHVRPDEARALIEKYRFDFVLGTLHNLRLCPDFRFFKFELMKQPQLDFTVRRVVDESVEIVNFGVHSLAHLDYIRNKFTSSGVTFDADRYADDFARLFRLMIQKGTAMEVNTSPFAKNGYTSPQLDYVRLYRELGGELISLGADSHASHLVGSGIPETAAILRELGFKSQTVIRNGKISQIEL